MKAIISYGSNPLCIPIKPGDILLLEQGPFRFHQYQDQLVTIRNIRTGERQNIDSEWFFSYTVYFSEEKQKILRKLYN